MEQDRMDELGPRAEAPPGTDGEAAGEPAIRCREVVVRNATGLHLRAAVMFAEVAIRFAAEVRVRRDGRAADGRSILDLVALGAARGDRIELQALGEDADAALEAIAALAEAGFDESARGRDGHEPRSAPDGSRGALTPGEEEVLRRVARGLINREIAEELGIGIEAVVAHKARAMEKLGLETRAGVVRYAMGAGWFGS
jgi:phosphocarrier protein